MKAVERRLLRMVPRRAMTVLGALALAQGVLLVVQADLLARAIAGLDAGWLVPLACVVAGRAALTWASGGIAARGGAAVKARLRAGLLRGGAGRDGGITGDGGAVGGAGARVTLLTRGLDAIDPFFTGYLPQLLVACLVPPLVLARLAVADWPSAVVVAVTVPLVPVFGALVGLRTAALTGRQWALLARLGGHFRDVLAGLSTLRSFGRAGHQSGVVRDLADEHRRASVRALKVAFLSSLVLELVCALSVAVVAVPVGLRLLNGDMPLVTGLLVLILVPEAYLPLRALGARFHASAEGVAAAEQAFEALDGEDAPERPEAGVVLPHRAPEIVLEDVTVRYPGAEHPALDRVSLRIAPGERVAVTGPSGAGKSTLLLVLAGLVAPESGRVLVNGVDLADLDVAAWRRGLGWVPQRPHLFAASIADNIALGSPDATRPQVEDAARAAAAEDFIHDLPGGYDTVLGERGTGLSAGQRQRLALARAYLTGAPLMLLDEPSARLDLRSENALVRAAGRLLEDRTALIVAHRPALVALADRVVRIENGRADTNLRKEVAA
ncbi:thiol reductant ABC exporter subunit CydD [Actinomadura barringtoniae]|uniref:Thiol reductant ABC exporter subunit CydD n=1 Tax=Actinomadura barringtoniae TaxID=1427535 RepID=A0A939T926_9ACTN|nr:thiol reductant ABC exporter subunit CydD [Actinomadura barringtoniae]MBO2454733.1 thiol reductant ABC exporter subunit CydD [Actinomadura barringtoniae]